MSGECDKITGGLGQLPENIRSKIIAAHEKNLTGISRFSIYRHPSSNKQSKNEAEAILSVLSRFDMLIKLNDVCHGAPGQEPDFIFKFGGGLIGVELTELEPKIFKTGGHREKGQFRTFERESGERSSPEVSFPWPEYTLRDALNALDKRLREKQRKAKPWFTKFQECWLLMQITSGGPFGEIVASHQHMNVECNPREDKAFRQHSAKITSCINQICEEREPFNHVILFFHDDLMAFPAGVPNPHGLTLPVPRRL